MYQKHGCRIYTPAESARPHRSRVDAPQREPRRSERCNTLDVIIVVVKGRERGCAQYDRWHLGTLGIGGSKVGRLRGDASVHERCKGRVH